MVDFLHEQLLRLPVILLAITVHEFAHAIAASWCGDSTARDLGRVTLDPRAHLDPVGTLCIIFAPIGWGRPVPVDPSRFRNPRRDDVLVSIAGPISNILQAVLWALPLYFLVRVPDRLEHDFLLSNLFVMCYRYGIVINLSLAFFNMIPLFPLDGYHVLKGFLPWPTSGHFDAFSRRYGAGILMLLIFLPHLGFPIDPIGAVLEPPILAGIRLLIPGG
jgi:Zn-dependent protease